MNNRELDAKIAEVMGWMQTRAEIFVSPPTGRVYVIDKFWKDDTELQKEINTIGELLHTSDLFTLWQPSTNIAAAMQVAEKMRKDGYDVTLTLRPNLEYGCRIAPRGEFNTERTFKSAGTLPLAICHAALKAMEDLC